MASIKRKALSLDQRIEVIKMAENGTSQRKIAELFKVGKTQIQNTVKRKAEYQADFEASSPLSKKKKARLTGNEPINDLLYKWFVDTTNRKINVNGPMLQEQALKFAADLDIPTFAASNGWLQSFIKRHKLIFRQLCGKFDDVRHDAVSSWNDRIPAFTQGYAERDIYSADETSLFFKTSTNSNMAFHVEGQKCRSGKKSKDRITIFICANLLGEKEPLIVIGKSVRPRAFGCLDIKQLPVTYKGSQKAWMTTEIFINWLDNFNERMKRQNRNVILFLNHAPSHPDQQLSNVKLQFFPLNTSVLQPLDMGVIQVLKLRYRTAQFRYMLAEIETDNASRGIDIMNRVTILNAIHWIASSWREVEASTITSCFYKAGIKSQLEICNQIKEEPIDIPHEYDQLSYTILGMPFLQLVEMDNGPHICDAEPIDWNLNANILISKFNSEEDSDDADGDEGDEVLHKVRHVSVQEGFASLSTLRDFLQQRCMASALRHLDAVEEEMIKSRLEEKEKRIPEF